ncbi:S49 family peptidase [Spongorhabdus nitratireducens]
MGLWRSSANNNDELMAGTSGSEESRLLRELLVTQQKDQRRDRRWRIFFRLMGFGWLFLITWALMSGGSGVKTSAATEAATHVGLVDVRGPIGAAEEANADLIVTALRGAFEAPASKAVVLRINSPGGSPVQSGYVYDEISRLKALYPEKKVYAVISDIGASGAYYIAAAADEIYADKASMVGSIGVVSSGFGFVEAMKKLGISRRTYTSGEYKDFMDPFQPQEKATVAHWQSTLDNVHQQFIKAVRDGRGERLKEDKKTFSGLVWTGEQALDRGLIDGLGSTSFVAREVIGVEKLVDYTVTPSPLERFAKQLGAGAGQVLATSLGLENNILLR